METRLVPVNTEGKPNNLAFTIEAAGREEARMRFNQACYRLLHPELWHKLAGVVSAECRLIADNGDESYGPALMGDHIRINVPGPGTRAGDGFDWVVVDAIENGIDAGSEVESYGLRLRPCANPFHKDDDVAHFFKNTATSTFIICREGNMVKALYYGRNEVPNTDIENKVDNIRNAVLAAGAIAGFSELQWMALLKGFLEPEK